MLARELDATAAEQFYPGLPRAHGSDHGASLWDRESLVRRYARRAPMRVWIIGASVSGR